jgi:hypothetical protein
MDTSGQPMRPTSRRSDAHGRLVRAAVGFLAALLIGGCATSMTIGKAPATDRLGELKWNVSTDKDVVAVLGEPQGHGATRSPTYGLKETWLYYSAVSEGAQVRSRMLMVFLDKDTHVYQGYMWVASGILLGQTR